MKNFINYNLFFFLISSVAFSQVENFEEKGYIPIMPQTPNVASMQKFQETSVSKYTGLPSINVPIFTIDLKELQIPIFLDYHSAGIRVNETASWVGQNWNLVAGGSVIRTVKHLADDMPNYGYINNPITAPIIHDECMSNPSGATCVTYLNQKLINNEIDFEPDLFNYNAPGISGKFMFDQNRTFPDHPKGRVISFPKTENKITPYFNGPKIIGFYIYDNKGNRFEFEIGNELLFSDSHTVSETNLPEATIKPFTSSYVQTWNLTKITTFLGEIVNFYYTTENYNECSFASQKRVVYSSNQESSLSTTYSSTSGTTTYLSLITGDFGSISFARASYNREDHDSKALGEIIISNNTEVIKKVEFNYSYTQSNFPNYTIYGCANNGSGLLYDHQQTPGNNNQAYTKYTKRMFLDSLKIKDLNISNGDDSYSYYFEYNNEYALPHRNSYAQDFWGYYNGQNNNSMCLDFSDYMGYNDPNRHISTFHSKLGLLKKIVYPEGGYTVFEHETNKGLTEIDGLLSFRMVPYQIDEIEINTDIEPTPNFYDDGLGNHVYIYKKPILINHRNFPLINNGHFTYSSLTTSDCVYDINDLPPAGACSLWMNIKKTDIDPSQFSDVLQINLNTINYNIDNSYSFTTLLNGGHGGGLTIDEIGVYVLELEVRTPIVPSPQPGGGTIEFDPNQHMASLNLKYKTTPSNVKFYEAINGQFQNVEIPIGGQRIKSIKTFGNDNVLSLSKTYTYTLEGQNISSGKSLSIPYFLANDQYSVYELSYCAVPLVTTSSNHLGYTRVVEKRFKGLDHTNTNSIIDEYTFYDIRMNTGYIHQYAPFIEDWRNGQNIKNEIPEKSINLFAYDDNWQEIIESDLTSHYFGMISPITERAHRYTFLTYVQFNQSGGGGSGGLYQGNNVYRLQYGYPTLILKDEEQFFDNNSVVKTTVYEYDNPELLSPTSIRINTSNLNKNYLNKMYYPHDMLNIEPYMQSLIAGNRIAQPVIKEVYIEEGGIETLLSTNKTIFAPANTNVLPKYIQTAKDNNALETRFTIDLYDSKGNVLQSSLTNGPKTSYIYGYNHQYPVAKIENKAYSTIPSGLISAIHTASSGTGSEAQLQTALDNLRNDTSMANTMITTYTYSPLVGVTTITGPNGDRIRYYYDEFGRLDHIRDKNGNLIEEYEYNYGNN